MAINFPSSPSNNQVFSATLPNGRTRNYTYNSTKGVWRVQTAVANVESVVNDVVTTAGFTSNTGDITGINISAGTGLTGSASTTSGQHTQTISMSHLGFQNLSDPNDDRIAFWDDGAGSMQWLDIGSNLSISGTTLNASVDGGNAASVDGYSISVVSSLPASPDANTIYLVTG